MTLSLWLYGAIAVLFALMAFRAFRSGSATDYLLSATQVVGVLLLLSPWRELACYLLLITAVAYLISQVLTGARVVSRLLPVVGAVVITLALLQYPLQ